MTDVVALCAELLSIQSPTGGEGKIVEFVSRRLVSRGWLAGESVLTTSDGRSTSVRATAWMVEGSGMLAVFSRTDD